MLLQILKGDNPDPTPEQLRAIQQKGGDVMVNQNEVTNAVKQIVEALEKYITSPFLIHLACVVNASFLQRLAPFLSI